VRPELVLIELHARGTHRVAYPLRQRDELLARLHTHPPDPRVAAIRKESGSLEKGLERFAAADRDSIHDRFLLLSEECEGQVLGLGTDPRCAW